MRMPDLFQNGDFPIDSINVWLIFDFIFFQYFNSNFVAGYNMSSLFDLSKCTFSDNSHQFKVIKLCIFLSILSICFMHLLSSYFACDSMHNLIIFCYFFWVLFFFKVNVFNFNLWVLYSLLLLVFYCLVEIHIFLGLVFLFLLFGCD